ncbi:unnamed protein product [Pleuronectes platessa]|uniref:Uncharacterized protein n=1 Tax=Pleuronectes platessa TaxID=8262 RepID=A0A9N7URJ8_PLEPL|nr:unnamed protein product [Pleuronectes platessa]
MANVYHRTEIEPAISAYEPAGEQAVKRPLLKSKKHLEAQRLRVREQTVAGVSLGPESADDPLSSGFGSLPPSVLPWLSLLSNYRGAVSPGTRASQRETGRLECSRQLPPKRGPEQRGKLTVNSVNSKGLPPFLTYNPPAATATATATTPASFLNDKRPALLPLRLLCMHTIINLSIPHMDRHARGRAADTGSFGYTGKNKSPSLPRRLPARLSVSHQMQLLPPHSLPLPPHLTTT